MKNLKSKKNQSKQRKIKNKQTKNLKKTQIQKKNLNYLNLKEILLLKTIMKISQKKNQPYCLKTQKNLSKQRRTIIHKKKIVEEEKQLAR